MIPIKGRIAIIEYTRIFIGTPVCVLFGLVGFSLTVVSTTTCLFVITNPSLVFPLIEAV